MSRIFFKFDKTIIVIKLHHEEQEKHYTIYQGDTINLSEAQKEEILKRDNDFIVGKTTAKDWNDIKRELKSKYS